MLEAKLSSFCNQLSAAFETLYPDFGICLFGHIGDGNLRSNVMQPEPMYSEAFWAYTARADATLFGPVQSHGGSMSDEWGIELLKKPDLHFSRTFQALRVMAQAKATLQLLQLRNLRKIFYLEQALAP